MPSPNATILLNLVIAPIVFFRLPKIEFANILVFQELISRSVKYDSTVLKNIAVMRDRKNANHVLIDNQHC